MIKYPRKFTLVIEEENNTYTQTFVLEDDGEWQHATMKLLDTVSACWGYDVKESIAFISDLGYWDEWSLAGEKTISRGAYNVAKGFDNDRLAAEEEAEYE